MEAHFWHDLWAANDIGFHEANANDLLVAHFDVLNLPKGGRVLVPLCGKTRDIAWLLARGCHVLGVELSQSAIEQLFDDLKMTPTITLIDGFQLYSAPMIDIFVGDIFGLTTEKVERIDAIYDRAALVALPDDMRSNYARLLETVTRNAAQLLICFEYDQSEMSGPPFSITPATLDVLYAKTYARKECAARDAQIRGAPAVEKAWHLMPGR